MKYTVSGSTLQYNVGLTFSFLSLISRGVGAIQKRNTSISNTYDMRGISVQTATSWICRQNLKSWDPILVKKATKSVNLNLYFVL